VTRRVLVTDGQERAALAVTRSLGAAGHRVFVAATRRRSIAGVSRHTTRQFQLPDSLLEPDGFLEGVRAVVIEHEIDTVVPISDASLMVLLAHRRVFGQVLLPFPSLETFQAVSDKERVLQVARTLGIATPQQVVASGPEQVLGQLGNLTFPVIAKPARSTVVGERDASKFVVHQIRTEEDLVDLTNTLPAHAYPLLLQERIVGEGTGVFVLIWGGKLLATAGHRRLREKPPAGGVSVYRESIVPDPDLLDRSIALLHKFGWEGVAMVEYKQQTSSGRLYLMEVNGRFWGSLQLAIDAGVDFPVLLLNAALGFGSPQGGVTCAPGLASRWWWGDVDHLMAVLRKSRHELALPPSAPSRWQAVTAFLKATGAQERCEVMRRDDWRPFLQESADWLRGR